MLQRTPATFYVLTYHRGPAPLNTALALFRRSLRMKKAVMAMPPGFTFRREGTGLFAERATESFGVTPMRRELWNGTVARLAETPGTELDRVTFGASSGFRVSYLGRVTSFLLRVEGKHVGLSLQCDSAVVAPVIHTLGFREDEV